MNESTRFKRTFFRNGLVSGLCSVSSNLASPEDDASPRQSGVHFYTAIVFVAAVIVSLFATPYFSMTQVVLIRFVGAFTSGSQLRLLISSAEMSLGLASPVVSVWVFYVIGKKVDFRPRLLTFAAISFIGTLTGITIDYLAYAPLAGEQWATGFGSVAAWGTGDLTSLLSIITATVGFFMIPVAGLALSSFRRDSQRTAQNDNAVERPRFRSFYVTAFVIAALAQLVSAGVYQTLGFLTHGTGLIFIESSDPWQSLISGYTGFLVYPVLLIATFYFLGRGLTMGRRDVREFGLRTFAAAAAGLLSGLVLSVSIYDGWEFLGSFILSNLPSHIEFLTLNGILVLAVGFGSASLGIFGGGDRGDVSVPRGRRGFFPIAVSVLLVIIVAISALASYAFALNPALSASKYSCTYQPGQAFYLKVVSDQSGTPLAGQTLSAQLLSVCPIFTECNGLPGQTPCSMGTRFGRVLGSWNFITNSTGFVAVPGRMLGGSDLWFSLGYLGHAYQAKYQICGGGITFSQLSLPSGSSSGREVPMGKTGVNAGSMSNGTQYSEGCNPTSFSGNATRS